MKNKYLITGYSGFVAKHFLDFLESTQKKCSVLGIDVNEPAFSIEDHKHVQCNFQKIDLLNKAEVERVMIKFQPDLILHLASYSSVSYSWQNPVASFVNNTNIFLNLVDQIRLLKLNCRILSVGSSEEYGNVTSNMLPLHEELPSKPVSPYAVARVSQEMLSKIYADSYGLDIVLTRSFNHIGPGQKDVFVIPSFAKKLVEIKLHNNATTSMTVGNINIIRDFVDVRDVVRAYYLLLHNGRKGEVYNICSAIGVSLREVLQKMLNILDLNVEMVIDKTLVRPNDNQIIIGSNEKIKREIKWNPSIPFEQSLKDIINYWSQKSGQA